MGNDTNTKNLKTFDYDERDSENWVVSESDFQAIEHKMLSAKIQEVIWNDQVVIDKKINPFKNTFIKVFQSYRVMFRL